MNRYSGKFVLRLSPDLHAQVASRAQAKGFSLNRCCVELIAGAMDRKDQEAPWEKPMRKILPQLRKKFGSHLLGVVLFGSVVRGEAHDTSDLDVLIVLEQEVLLERSLYRWWDENVRFAENFREINPHFVHLPKTPTDAGGIWFETALDGKVIFQKGRRLEKILGSLLECVHSGRMQRAFSNGHPYWTWREK